MENEPRFLQPVPPEPTRMSTLNYDGGSLTATRGLIAQIFLTADFLSTCAVVPTDRSRKSYTSTPYIGGTPRIVNASTWTEQKYPSQTKSIAAGGEPIQIQVQGQWWSARLSGNHSAFMKFLCDGKDDLTGPIAWRSARGTLYGPVGN